MNQPASLGFSYGFPLVFLWFSYGFPMVWGTPLSNGHRRIPPMDVQLDRRAGLDGGLDVSLDELDPSLQDGAAAVSHPFLDGIFHYKPTIFG